MKKTKRFENRSWPVQLKSGKRSTNVDFKNVSDRTSTCATYGGIADNYLHDDNSKQFHLLQDEKVPKWHRSEENQATVPFHISGCSQETT
jgi:hypothetical protein